MTASKEVSIATLVLYIGYKILSCEINLGELPETLAKVSSEKFFGSFKLSDFRAGWFQKYPGKVLKIAELDISSEITTGADWL